jgi:hypothetical protein
LIGGHLTPYEGDDVPKDYIMDQDNVFGMRDDMPKAHLHGVARWLERESGKGVMGKPALNLFMVFVKVLGRTPIY